MSVPYYGDFAEDDTVLLPFNTFDSNDPSESVTITNLADADIKVHKDGGTTPIATDGATIEINYASITGNHLVTVDTSAHADYAVGSEYAVRIEGTTVDGATINAWVGAFSIERAGGALAIAKTIKAETVLILADTDVIGALGAGLTDLGGMSNGMKSEVASEAGNAIVNFKLDHLVFAADGDDPVDGSIMAHLVSATEDWSTFDPSTASLEVLHTQIGAIGASAGGALNFEAAEDNSGGTIDPGTTAFVGNETNNFTDTDREDGTYHVITDATNVIDVVYGFSVGGGRTATELVFKGFANANNDDLTISVWAHPVGEWETLGTLAGGAGTTNITITEALLSKHTGTGSEIGKVYIRFDGSSLSGNADLNTDQILIEAVGIGQTVGYALGAVWLATANGVDGTEPHVNGVADNACKTIANVVSLLAAVKLHRVEVSPGSSLTFGEAHTDEFWAGRDWNLALGSQNITGIFAFGAAVTGTGTATAGYEFEECAIGAVTLDDAGHFELCALTGTFTVGQAGTFTFHSCFTRSAGAITIDFAAVGATAIHMFDFNGQINFKNMAAGDTVHITGAGDITTETCTAGTIDHDGPFEYTDSGGNVTEQKSDIEAAVDATLLDTAQIGTAGAGLSNINLPNQTMDITGSLSGAVGSVAGAVGSVAGNVDGSVGSVTGAVGSVTGAVGSVTGAVGSVAGNVDGNVTGSIGSLAAQAKADVNAEADTALAGYDGPTNAEMVARTLAAGPLAQLTQNVDNCFTGTASGTPTTTTMVSDIGVTVDDQFNGRIITFDDDTATAALRGQSTDITACTASSNTLTFTELTTAPVSGDKFVIT